MIDLWQIFGRCWKRCWPRRGLALGICCHPYDVCTELVARELGVIVTDVQGQPLSAPLNIEANVDWIGYANKYIQTQVEPVLQAALRKRGASLIYGRRLSLGFAIEPPVFHPGISWLPFIWPDKFSRLPEPAQFDCPTARSVVEHAVPK